MREINTGRGICLTDLTPAEIAVVRSRRIESLVDRYLFIDTFDRIRHVADVLLHLPLELELICVELTRDSTVTQAAMIEALASLRAEGVKV